MAVLVAGRMLMTKVWGCLIWSNPHIPQAGKQRPRVQQFPLMSRYRSQALC